MKIKLQSDDVSPLLDAVIKFLQMSPKEASDFIKKHIVHEPTCKWVCIDVERPRKEIEVCASHMPGIEIQFLDDVDEVQNLNDNATAPESANYHEAEQKLQKTKLQEVTDEDLGVSIHSIDKMSIRWQCKILFNHRQATRVLAGLHDAKFNVTEALVMHEGNKVTMLVITKTFPTGTRKEDLEKFEKLLRTFIYTVCKMVSLEDELEETTERAIEAFNKLQDYE